jgi:hypothetical protein
MNYVKSMRLEDTIRLKIVNKITVKNNNLALCTIYLVKGGCYINNGMMKYKIRQFYNVVCCIMDVNGGLISSG